MSASLCSSNTNPVSLYVSSPSSLHSSIANVDLVAKVAFVKKALKEKGIDELLEEARESNRENDLEHMKKGCRFPRFFGLD